MKRVVLPGLQGNACVAAVLPQRLPHRRLRLREPQRLALRSQSRLGLPHALDGAWLEHVWTGAVAVSHGGLLVRMELQAIGADHRGSINPCHTQARRQTRLTQGIGRSPLDAMHPVPTTPCGPALPAMRMPGPTVMARRSMKGFRP